MLTLSSKWAQGPEMKTSSCSTLNIITIHLGRFSLENGSKIKIGIIFRLHLACIFLTTPQKSLETCTRKQIQILTACM
jgi:hypothetical protein